MGCVRFLLDCAVSGMHFWLPLLIDAIMQGSLTGRGMHVSLVDSRPPHGTAKAVQASDTWWAKHGSAVLTTVPFAVVAVTSYAVAASAKERNEQRLHTAVPMLLGAMCFMYAAVSYRSCYHHCGAGSCRAR